MINLSADFNDIPAIESCLTKYQSDETVVDNAAFAVQILIDPKAPGHNAAELLSWLNEHKSQWRDKNYTDYWGSKLMELLNLYSKDGNPQLRGALAQTWESFLQSPDSRRAVPFILRFITQADPNKEADRSSLSALLWGLQLYAGPLNIPHKQSSDWSLAEIKKGQKDAIAWWGANKEKAPVYWLLDSLAKKGYDTGNPKDAKSTAKAL